MSSPLCADAVIVGAGFAGASTAYWLTRLGMKKVVLLEKEDLPGRHATGQNAAMARQAVSSRAIFPLAVEGVRFLANPPSDFEQGPLLRATGSLILASGREAADLRAFLPALLGAGLPVRWISLVDVEARVPPTRGGSFEGALACATDGVVDISALLAGYLAAATGRGARLMAGRDLRSVVSERGRVVAVETGTERIETPIVVNAAGAWAKGVAALAGAAPLPLRPFRRHLVSTARMEGVDPEWPFTWDVTHGVYFRPEPPGLLLSPCDETEFQAGVPAVDPAATELLGEKLAKFYPALADIPVLRAWAGLRTLTPDGNFLLGRDPFLEGFVWCAGLGGHGMTTSAAAGRIAAEAALGSKVPEPHDPARYTAETARRD